MLRAFIVGEVPPGRKSFPRVLYGLVNIILGGDGHFWEWFLGGWVNSVTSL